MFFQLAMRTLTTFLAFILLTFSSYSQNGQPAFSTFSPVYNPGYNNAEPIQNSDVYRRNPLQYHRQLEEQRIRQQNRELLRQQGFNPPPTQAEIEADITRQRLVEAQIRKIEKEKQLQNIPYYKKPEFIEATKEYNEAYQILKDMLEGEIPLSLKDAVYVIENAYLQGNQKINYADYNKKIKELTKFCRLYLAQQGFNSNDNLAVNMVIQAFMSDTLTVTDPATKEKIVHYPFVYDFENYDPDNDFGNYLFTKVLLKGAGQCHSLPIMYLVSAEELGGTAYWSFASIHSFIKFKDNRGTLFNYETTRGFITSDAYTMMAHFVNARAEKNKIYLDTVNKKQAVAYCLVDLARGYKARFDFADGTFMENCCKLSMQYFPNNIEAYTVLSVVYRNMLKNIMDNNGVRNIDQVLHITSAKEIYDKFVGTNRKIESLGYQIVPKEMYEFWVKSIADEATIKKDLQHKSFLKKQLTRVAKSN